MVRPTLIRDEDLLAAVREVLRERGVQATSAHVAKKAGVSEGTLFKRFRSKDELFYCAMHTMEQPEWIVRLPARVGEGSFERQMREIAVECIAFFRHVVPMAMMSWSNQPAEALRSYRMPDGKPLDPPWAKGNERLAHYFAAELRARKLRAVDPAMLAELFTGALWNFVSKELMFGKEATVSEQDFVACFVDVIHHGLVKPLRKHAAPRERKRRS